MESGSCKITGSNCHTRDARGKPLKEHSRRKCVAEDTENNGENNEDVDDEKEKANQHEDPYNMELPLLVQLKEDSSADGEVKEEPCLETEESLTERKSSKAIDRPQPSTSAHVTRGSTKRLQCHRVKRSVPFSEKGHLSLSRDLRKTRAADDESGGCDVEVPEGEVSSSTDEDEGSTQTRKQQLSAETDSKEPVKCPRVRRTFCCEICGKCFTCNSNLVVHRRIHTGERPFVCPLCKKDFAKKENLHVHMRVHSEERPFMCCFCGKAFKRRGELVKHTRRHSGEKPYVCRECKKSFSQSSSLAYHMNIHAEEKPFKCLLCGKAFLLNRHLSAHMRFHEERAFKCGECGKAFALKNDLIKHERTHSGERPFCCIDCGWRFTQSSHLSAHRRRLHVSTTAVLEDVDSSDVV